MQPIKNVLIDEKRRAGTHRKVFHRNRLQTLVFQLCPNKTQNTAVRKFI